MQTLAEEEQDPAGTGSSSGVCSRWFPHGPSLDGALHHPFKAPLQPENVPVLHFQL